MGTGKVKEYWLNKLKAHYLLGWEVLTWLTTIYPSLKSYLLETHWREAWLSEVNVCFGMGMAMWRKPKVSDPWNNWQSQHLYGPGSREMAKLCSSVQVLVLINMNDWSVCAKINSYSFLLLDAHLQKRPTEASSSPTPHLHVVPDQFTDFPSCDAIGSSRG